MRFAYSMAGEGRGHTTRGLGLGQALIDRGHEVRFFTSGDSPELLRARFGDDRVIEMDIPRLHYNRRGLDLIKTAGTMPPSSSDGGRRRRPSSRRSKHSGPTL